MFSVKYMYMYVIRGTLLGEVQCHVIQRYNVILMWLEYNIIIHERINAAKHNKMEMNHVPKVQRVVLTTIFMHVLYMYIHMHVKHNTCTSVGWLVVGLWQRSWDGSKRNPSLT